MKDKIKIEDLLRRAEVSMHKANQLGELGADFMVSVNKDEFIYLISYGARVIELNHKEDNHYISRLKYEDYVFTTSTKIKI